MSEQDTELPPSKRVKLDAPQQQGEVGTSTTISPLLDKGDTQMADSKPAAVMDDATKEREVGIIAFVDVSRNLFRGVLKTRYTDFLVNEILPDGRVLHLQSTKVKNQQGQSHAEVSEAAGERAEVADGGKTAVKPEPPAEAKLVAEEKVDPVPEKVSADSQDAQANAADQELSEDDRTKLLEYFNEETVTKMSHLHQSVLQHPGWKSRDHPMVRTEFTSDRSIRGQIHQDIRRIFNSKIESSTDKDGILVLTASSPSSNNPRNRGGNQKSGGGRGARQNKPSWQDRGGQYVHFSLYKENKDTLEVISYLTKQLRTNPKTFQFAGTKDRRAVTVQRVSAYRVEAETLVGLNRTLKYAAVGDYEYRQQGLELGDLSGNEFVVTLRNCQLEDVSANDNLPERKAQMKSYLLKSLQQLRNRGFLNFYGLQRFGTFATRTDMVGLKILQGDFQGACDGILEFSPLALNAGSEEVGVLVGQDDRARAEGINTWRTTLRVGDALDKIPRKFSAEQNVIRHLGRQNQDFLGALLGIQRNLRLMYVHAYQSLVWNLAVGERWRLYGDQVVEGDLVLFNEHKDKREDADDTPQETVDADGEVIIEPTDGDRSYDKDDLFERARALTKGEAASGAYNIFDIVLPLPGFDVLYPANDSGAWYKAFMTSDAGGGLDPYDMRRKNKDFSLSGSYRKIMARIGRDFGVNVHDYCDEDGQKQFVETDLEKLKENGRQQAHGSDGKEDATEKQGEESLNGKDDLAPKSERTTKLAAVFKFQLGSSQYATMALRELSRGGIQAFKAEFMGGR